MRKVDIVVKWSVKYFIIEVEYYLTCLLCNDSIAAGKEYSIRHYYDTRYEQNFQNL